jgi:hypothetical protein
MRRRKSLYDRQKEDDQSAKPKTPIIRAESQACKKERREKARFGRARKEEGHEGREGDQIEASKGLVQEAQVSCSEIQDRAQEQGPQEQTAHPREQRQASATEACVHGQAGTAYADLRDVRHRVSDHSDRHGVGVGREPHVRDQ